MGRGGGMDLGGLGEGVGMIKTHYEMLKEVTGKHTRSNHSYVCIDTFL